MEDGTCHMGTWGVDGVGVGWHEGGAKWHINVMELYAHTDLRLPLGSSVQGGSCITKIKWPQGMACPPKLNGGLPNPLAPCTFELVAWGASNIETFGLIPQESTRFPGNLQIHKILDFGPLVSKHKPLIQNSKHVHLLSRALPGGPNLETWSSAQCQRGDRS